MDIGQPSQYEQGERQFELRILAEIAGAPKAQSNRLSWAECQTSHKSLVSDINDSTFFEQESIFKR